MRPNTTTHLTNTPRQATDSPPVPPPTLDAVPHPHANQAPPSSTLPSPMRPNLFNPRPHPIRRTSATIPIPGGFNYTPTLPTLCY